MLLLAPSAVSAQSASSSATPPNPYADAPEAPPSADASQARAAPHATSAEAPRAASEARAAPAGASAPATSAPGDAEPADDPSGALVELSAAASRVDSPPPSDAFGALDEVLAGDRADPLAGVERAARDSGAEVEGAPSRAETAAAIERVTPIVRACAADRAGHVVELRIVFASSGRVTTATVASDSARLSPGQRSCVARAVRRARVPAFDRARFEVTYPMRF